MLTASDTAAAVVVLGRQTDLVELILEEIRRHGDIAIYGGAPSISDSGGVRPHDADPRQIAANVESVLVMIDHEMVDELFRDHDSRRTRKLLRSGGDHITEFVTDTVVGADADRLLVLCDARHASPAEKSQALRWVRQMMLRIGYECSINGTDDLSPTYEVFVDDADVQRTVRTIARWHGGLLGRHRGRPALSVGG